MAWCPYNERKCILCNQNDLGDNSHHLPKCSFFETERRELLRPRYYCRPNIIEPREVMRKAVLTICELHRRRSVCESAQSVQYLYCSLPRWNNISSVYIQNSKLLASICGCAGRLKSYLVENPENRFSRDAAQLNLKICSSYCTMHTIVNLAQITYDCFYYECLSVGSNWWGQYPQVWIFYSLTSSWMTSYPLWREISRN